MTQPQFAAPASPPLPLGSPAPPFTAVAGTGEELSLAQFLGKRVVIAFYPFDFTGGWTTEHEHLEQHLDGFQERNAQVLSISCDSRYSHAIFAEQMGGISFPMLSDFHPHGEITRAYNVWNPQRGCPVRSVFILDEAGVVRWAHMYAPGTLPEPQDLFDALDALGGAAAG